MRGLNKHPKDTMFIMYKLLLRLILIFQIIISDSSIFLAYGEEFANQVLRAPLKLASKKPVIVYDVDSKKITYQPPNFDLILPSDIVGDRRFDIAEFLYKFFKDKYGLNSLISFAGSFSYARNRAGIVDWDVIGDDIDIIVYFYFNNMGWKITDMEKSLLDELIKLKILARIEPQSDGVVIGDENKKQYKLWIICRSVDSLDRLIGVSRLFYLYSPTKIYYGNIELLNEILTKNGIEGRFNLHIGTYKIGRASSAATA